MDIDELKKLWVDFGDIPINDDGEILENFLDFEIGTDRFEIWHWFEEQNDEFIIGEFYV